MTSTRTRALAAAALVVALATGTAACGGDKSAGSSKAAGAAAGSSASAAPTAAQSPLAVTPAAFLQQVAQKTGGQKSAKVSEDIKTPSGEVTAQGPISWGDGLLGSLTMQLPTAVTSKVGSGGPADVIYQSDAMYVNLHMSQAALAQLGGKHWFKYDYADLAKLMGAAGTSFENSLKNADPVTAVQSMIASGQVTEVGKDSVNGTPATHYAADLNLGQMSGAGTSLTQDQVSALRQQLQSQGVTKAHFDVWVDGQGLLLKQEAKSQTANGQIDVSATYTDYGTQVTVTPPAADDTVDAAQLIARAQQGQSGGN
ncbi:hypothetical protein [Kitasatospora sp. NBC_01266]|uniref:hypothetical protein n=1 Tax=Kitasatospora sp. NBC_01266 TaxID=2903572 RepID=UPI002E368C83|nr:hypothetical protein [Kitasatospora sp. NBC_01266]